MEGPWGRVFSAAELSEGAQMEAGSWALMLFTVCASDLRLTPQTWSGSSS